MDDGGRVNPRIAICLRIAGVAALAAIGAVAASSCGAAEVMVRSRSSQQIVTVEADDCSVQYQTLAVAVEAFWASTGGPPASETELVSADMLREEVDDFDVIIADADYEVVGVYECAQFDPAAPREVAATEPLPDRACEADRRTLETAWEAYNADLGRPPESEADLVAAGLLYEESPGFDLVGSVFVPVAGLCD